MLHFTPVKLERFLARTVLPTLVAVVCLAATEPKHALALPPAVAGILEGKKPAKVTDLDLKNSEIRAERSVVDEGPGK